MTQDRLEEIILRTAEGIAGTELTGPQRVSVLQSLAALLLGPEGSKALSQSDTGSLDEHIQARLRVAQQHALEACGVEPSSVEVRFVREHVADEPMEGTIDPTVQATGMATIVQTAGTLYQPLHRVVFTNDAGLAGLSARYGRAPDAFGTVALDSGMRAGLSSRPGLTVVSIAQDLAAVEGAIVESLPVGRQRERLRQESRGRDLVGTVLDDRYRIDHFIGRGGFGVVYRATLVHAPDIRVAIKVIDPRHASSTSVREGLKEEFGTLASLTHPGVVEWRGFGETNDGGIYFAMTYLDGEELSKVLKQETKLPPARAYPILLRILDALRYVHTKNVFHLDLKPANIFLVRDGARGPQQVKLIDFGISLRSSSSAASTGTVALDEAGEAKEPRPGTQGEARKSVPAGSLGSSMSATQRVAGGTPLYASPEQCKHLRRDRDFQALTGASDIYSFGIIAYQVLTGRFPYAEFPDLERRMRSSSPDEAKAAQLDTYRVHLEVPPIPLRRLEPKLDRRLGRLLERTLAKSPKDRFKNTEDCYQQFRAVLEPKPVWPSVVAAVLLLAVIALTLRAVYGPEQGPSTVELVRAAGSESVLHVSPDDGPTFVWPEEVVSNDLPQLLGEDGQIVSDLEVIELETGFGLRRSADRSDTKVEGRKLHFYWPELDLKSNTLTLGLDPALQSDALVRSVKALLSNDSWTAGTDPELTGMLVPESGGTLYLELGVDPAQGELLHPDSPATCSYSFGEGQPRVVANMPWRVPGESLAVNLQLPEDAQTFSFALTPRARCSSKGQLELPVVRWPKLLSVVQRSVRFSADPVQVSLSSPSAALPAAGTTADQGAHLSRTGSRPRYEFIRRKDDQRPPDELEFVFEKAVEPNGLDYSARLRCGELELVGQRLSREAARIRFAVPLAVLLSTPERAAGDGAREWVLTFELNQADQVLGATQANDERQDFVLAWDPEPVKPTARIDGGDPFEFIASADPVLYVRGDDRDFAIELNGKGPMRFEAQLLESGEPIERVAGSASASADFPLRIAVGASSAAASGSGPEPFAVTLEVAAWSAHEGSLDDAEPHYRFACPVDCLEPMGVSVRSLPIAPGNAGAPTSAANPPDEFNDVASWTEAPTRQHVVAIGSGGGLEFLVTSAYKEAKLTIDGDEIPANPPGVSSAPPGTRFRWNSSADCNHAERRRLAVVLRDGSGQTSEFEIAFTPSLRPPRFEVTMPLPRQPWSRPADGNLFPVRVEVEGSEPAAIPLIDSARVRVLEAGSEFTELVLWEMGTFTGNISVPYRLSAKKITLEFEVSDRAGRVSSERIEDVTVPDLRFQYPSTLGVELAAGVGADMLFVDADNDARGSYRLLEFAPATTWERVLSQLGASPTGVPPAYRDQGAFEKRLTEDRQYGRWAKNAQPPTGDLSYYLDRSEVSVEQYRAFIQAANFEEAKWWPHLSGKDRTEDALAGRRKALRDLVAAQAADDADVRRPIVGVDWHAANAFALWSGRRLQSWFEWEYATRDGSRGRCFADPTEISLVAIRAPLEGSQGFVHLTGNVAEWTCTPQFKGSSNRDLLFTTFGPPADAGLQADTGRSTSRFFVVVGGAVSDPGSPVYFDYTAMNTHPETTRQPHTTLGPFGFRCALSANGALASLLDNAASAQGATEVASVPARDLGAHLEESK